MMSFGSNGFTTGISGLCFTGSGVGLTGVLSVHAYINNVYKIESALGNFMIFQ